MNPETLQNIDCHEKSQSGIRHFSLSCFTLCKLMYFHMILKKMAGTPLFDISKTKQKDIAKYPSVEYRKAF